MGTPIGRFRILQSEMTNRNYLFRYWQLLGILASNRFQGFLQICNRSVYIC